ncbi:hypothetical protein WS62_19795 [Burkholderia sp. ABCPW 14]|nr:hypothetical protein WS62_19795 [Burkholderia sp. ABCPW 14]
MHFRSPSLIAIVPKLLEDLHEIRVKSIRMELVQAHLKQPDRSLFAAKCGLPSQQHAKFCTFHVDFHEQALSVKTSSE